MKVKASKWTGGNPAIDMLEYQFNRDWFLENAAAIEAILDLNVFGQPAVGEKSLMTAYISKMGRVVLFMDETICSIAFENENARSRSLAKLISQLDWVLIAS